MLPASSDRLEEYRTAQKADATCSMIRHYCKNGWPHKSRVPDNLKQYCEIQSELSVCNDLLLRNSCIVVPKSLQKQTLEKIHHGHQGIQKCRSRANTAVWWPAMSSQINTMVKSCVECSKHVRVNCEPMISTPLLSLASSRVRSIPPQRNHIFISGRLFLQVSRNLQALYYHFTRNH